MSQQQKKRQDSIDIGEVLRLAREAKGMSIASVAMHTNLRKDVIEKLESNQFSDIGAPVFTRGYLNIYARFLEVDEELMAKEFSASAPVRHEQSLRIHSANVESQGKPYRRSMAKGWISLVLVLLVGGTLIVQLMNDQSWLMQQIRGAFDQQGQLDDTTDADVVVNEEVPLDTGFTIEVAGENSTNNALDTLPEPDSNATPIAGSTTLTLSSLENETAIDDSPDAVSAQPEEEQPAQVVSGKASLTTSLENWIEVRDKDGKVVASRIYKSGESIELDASGSPYRLNIGRPDAITLSVDGENKALADYRMAGQTRLFTLSIPNE